MDLSIKSFNCQGFKPRNYDFLRYLFSNNDILLLQEHWLFSFQFKNFTDLFPNSSFYALASMNDDDLTCARGYGGTCIIWKNNLDLKRTIQQPV